MFFFLRKYVYLYSQLDTFQLHETRFGITTVFSIKMLDIRIIKIYCYIENNGPRTRASMADGCDNVKSQVVCIPSIYRYMYMYIHLFAKHVQQTKTISRIIFYVYST